MNNTTSADAVCVVIRPEGTATWGRDVRAAENELGQHGVGRGALTPGSRLRIAMSDCALILPDVYADNPHAAAVLAHVAGVPADAAPPTRGPVVLFGWDPLNDWDSSRPFTDDERDTITAALTAAGCTTDN